MSLLYIAIMCLILFLPQILIHESSHAIFVHLFGMKITGFKPYPHFDKGYFHWGKIYWNPGMNRNKWQYFVICMAPVFTNIILGTIGFLWWLPLGVVNVADCLNNIKNFFLERGDIRSAFDASNGKLYKGLK